MATAALVSSDPSEIYDIYGCALLSLAVLGAALVDGNLEVLLGAT